MHLLLVEDDDADAVLLSSYLEPYLDRPMTRVPNLRAATEAAEKATFDVAVLDLALPDAWGLDALLRFCRRVPGVPVIVLTGTQQPDFADKARRAGALGFVSKTLPPEEITARLLALTRTLSGGELSPEDAELEGLDRVARAEQVTTTARLYGRTDLADADPTLWQNFVDRYGDLLDLVMEHATIETEIYLGEHLQAYAEDLGKIRVGPRDVVSIHTTALRERIELANGNGTAAILSEARLTVLEVMGHLAAHYRTASIGLDRDESNHGPNR